MDRPDYLNNKPYKEGIKTTAIGSYFIKRCQCNLNNKPYKEGIKTTSGLVLLDTMLNLNNKPYKEGIKTLIAAAVLTAAKSFE